MAKHETTHIRTTLASPIAGVLMTIACCPAAQGSGPAPDGRIEQFIAVDNVCAWPNLTVLPNGEIAAAIFNRPHHGTNEGDVEVWASADGGKLWEFRGTATSRDPGTNRMNVAAGLAHNGDLIVISSGWSGDGWRPGPTPRGVSLLPMVSRSKDGGRTWQRSLDVTLPEGIRNLIPYGRIIQGEGQVLAASFYSRGAYVLFSKDDGLTWGDAIPITNDNYNETTLLKTRSGRWLAAARAYNQPPDGARSMFWAHLQLFSSDDEGRSWQDDGPLTLPSSHPADLRQLADGRILLTYGIRERGHFGIGMRTSVDDGKTWNPPTRIINLEGTTDGGYPSTIQLTDGSLVTAYYSNWVAQHQRYHMGVVRWPLPPH